MKKITQEELTEFLRKHKLWLKNEDGGSRANLRRADLRDANLCDANLCGANLCDANLRGADLCGANLCGAKNVQYPIACPEKGAFIGFKTASKYIVELEILEDAKRSSATTRKCRCDKARVLSITKYDGQDAGLTEVASDRDSNFIYKVGEIVSVSGFDENRWNECSTGIHFFITRQEAVDYNG